VSRVNTRVSAAAPKAVATSGTALAFDFGERRLGVAVGELSLRISHPLVTIEADSDAGRLDAVAALIREWQPAVLVVGLPAHMDGTEHALSARCRKFARRLEARFGLPTALVDERLTSYAAGEALAQAGVRGRRQKQMLDQVAAQQILDTFFDLHRDAA
jgi:putative Holliday junction resolvase